MQSTKIKTLLIYRYLRKFSDEDNPLSSAELIDMLKRDGIECERKSIYADVKALNEIGCEVVSTVTPKRGFYLASREYEPPEVRLLVDAVKSAAFITPEKNTFSHFQAARASFRESGGGAFPSGLS